MFRIHRNRHSRFVGMWKRSVFPYKTFTKWRMVMRMQPLNLWTFEPVNGYKDFSFLPKISVTRRIRKAIFQSVIFASILESILYPKETLKNSIPTRRSRNQIEYWRLNIDDLWYRFALSFLLKLIEFLKYSIWLWHKSCANMMWFEQIGTKEVYEALQSIINSENIRGHRNFQVKYYYLITR